MYCAFVIARVPRHIELNKLNTCLTFIYLLIHPSCTCFWPI